MKGGDVNQKAFRLRGQVIDWTAVRGEIGVWRSIASIYPSCLKVCRCRKACEHQQQPPKKDTLTGGRAEMFGLVCDFCDFFLFF